MKSTGKHISENCATLRLWPEAAQVLGVGRSTIYEAARRGDIPTVRIGRLRLVPRRALERLLDHWDNTPFAPQPGAEAARDRG